MAGTDYAKKKNAELEELLKSRGLPTGGKKAEMVARLEEDDAKETADSEPSGAPAPAEKAPTEAIQPADAATIAAVNPAPPTVDAPTSTPLDVPADAAVSPAAPPKDYASGLATTSLGDELARRKARAARFGTATDAVTEELDKEIGRAKRFGLDAGESNSAVKGLNAALPEERKKRGREGRPDGEGRAPKRQDSRSRDNTAKAPKSAGLSDADRAKAEARAKRFGGGA